MEEGAFADSATFAPWEPPAKFDTIEIPDFPTEYLPEPVALFVTYLAEATQTKEEMGGTLALGILATAFQKRYEIAVTADWTEPLCGFFVAVAPPGERKSAVISALTKPVYEYEAEQRQYEAAEIAQNQTERVLLEKALQAAQNSAVKGKGSFEEKRIEALSLSAQLAEFEDMHPIRLLVDDTTSEKLIDIMEQQSGSITVASAEGGVFDAIQGRYDRNANFDVYLKGHAGDPISVDRIGRKSNYISKPRLTMLLTIQPSVLHGLMSNATMRGRGLCGRFLYTLCRSKVGHRKVSPTPMLDQVKIGYRQFVREILSNQEIGTVTLSPEANKRREEYQANIEKKLGREWEHMADWGGKLVGAMLRIAALLHLSSFPAATPVNEETIMGAIKFADFFGANAEAVYQLIGADEAQADARYLWRRIAEAGKSEITKRDLFNACKGKFKRVENMDLALRALVEMGYIRLEEVQTGGRPTQKIKVNPLARK